MCFLLGGGFDSIGRGRAWPLERGSQDAVGCLVCKGVKKLLLLPAITLGVRHRLCVLLCFTTGTSHNALSVIVYLPSAFYHALNMFWKQRAHAHWLEKGDRNTTFFHSFASERKKMNTVKKLRRDDGGAGGLAGPRN